MRKVREFERKNSLKTKIEFFTAHFVWKRHILRVILLFIIVILLWVVTEQYLPSFQSTNPIDCYQHVEMVQLDSVDSIELFDDILIADRQPQTDKTIFFLETRCSTNHLPQLNARQVYTYVNRSKSIKINHLSPSHIQTSMFHWVSGPFESELGYFRFVSVAGWFLQCFIDASALRARSEVLSEYFLP